MKVVERRRVADALRDLLAQVEAGDVSCTVAEAAFIRGVLLALERG